MLTMATITTPQNLNAALQSYRQDMAPWRQGVDNQMFRRDPVLYMLELADELRAGHFKPQSIRRYKMLMGNNKARQISALCLKDKVAQKAVLQVLSPHLEGLFHANSFAFRAKRSCDMALQLARHYINNDLAYIVHADVKDCFNQIGLNTLNKQIGKIIADKQVKKLIEQWLYSHASTPARFLHQAKGLPQGSVLSPLWCNLYLHQLDIFLTQKNITFIRYADDILLLTKTMGQASQANKYLCDQLARLKLSLNNDKTYLGISTNKITFLGKSLPNMKNTA